MVANIPGSKCIGNTIFSVPLHTNQQYPSLPLVVALIDCFKAEIGLTPPHWISQFHHIAGSLFLRMGMLEIYSGISSIPYLLLASTKKREVTTLYHLINERDAGFSRVT